MTKQCKALELLAELQAHHSNISDNAIDRGLQRIEAAIKDLITQHEAELAKAQGEWVDIVSEAQIDDDEDRWYQVGSANWRYALGRDLKYEGYTLYRIWESTFEPPAPPPIQPKPEMRTFSVSIPVSAIGESGSFDKIAAALCDPLTKCEIAELKARIS